MEQTDTFGTSAIVATATNARVEQIWVLYRRLDPIHQRLVLRMMLEDAPRGGMANTRTYSISGRFDLLDQLISSALTPLDEDLAVPEEFALGDPAPQYVPAEWVAELDTWQGDDAASFVVTWDEEE